MERLGPPRLQLDAPPRTSRLTTIARSSPRGSGRLLRRAEYNHGFVGKPSLSKLHPSASIMYGEQYNDTTTVVTMRGETLSPVRGVFHLQAETTASELSTLWKTGTLARRVSRSCEGRCFTSLRTSRPSERRWRRFSSNRESSL
jgi:hypothetical protein